MSTPETPVSPLLICDALGFSPQLLLDDIINVANNAVQDGVNGMEDFLLQWAETRSQKQLTNPKKTNTTDMDADWDTTKEVEQGLVAFQTLLEYHTDIAFDFFEAWSLRNIFVIPPGLPIVLPHYAGLELTLENVEKETALMEEIEKLRTQLENQRRLKRTLLRALSRSRKDLEKAQKRANIARPLETVIATYRKIPRELTTFHEVMSSMPPLDPSLTLLRQYKNEGKREWETGKTGYENWALHRLIARAGEDVAGAEVNQLVTVSGEIGSAEKLRAAAQTTEARRDLSKEDGMDMD